ncbi:MAG: hypothetical protein EP297_05210 [Gammaproteobacteria bacterium]|nr:MAG: hypothetical protein EP297_05210 [Gammaproteobacteria bacterium]
MPIIFSYFRVVFVAIMVFSSGAASAIDPEQARDQGALSRDHIEDWEFQEDIHVIPDYPDMSKVMPVQIDPPSSNFKYFIDPAGLTVGVDDLVRFTIIIKSSSGAKNVMHEVIRCDTREYKTLAYGTSDKTFYQIYRPEWKPIGAQTSTGMSYRKDLLTNYFCDFLHDTLDVSEILHRIKYPRTFREYYDDG